MRTSQEIKSFCDKTLEEGEQEAFSVPAVFLFSFRLKLRLFKGKMAVSVKVKINIVLPGIFCWFQRGCEMFNGDGRLYM